MSNQTYNGWTNYPTWNVKLWLDNEEPTYLRVQELIADAQASAPENSMVPDLWTVGQATKFILADNLREWVRDELAPDLGASFAADLLGYALDAVDWEEIAASYLSDLTERENA